MAIVSLALRRDPPDVLSALASEPGAFLVSVPDAERPTTLVGCRPVDELRLDDGEADPLGRAAAFVERAPRLDDALPFPAAGGVVGYLAYEAGRTTAPRARRHASPVPLAVLRRYDPILLHDHASGQWSVVSRTAGAARAPWLGRLVASPPPWDGPLGLAPLRPRWDAQRYAQAVRRILAYLAAGDAYQVNLTQPFTAPLAASAATLFARLARQSRAPYAAYFDAGAFQIVANSPELLVRRRGMRLETRPVKGTSARSEHLARDAALSHDLMESPKDRAEHVMIVDLERNDLGRVCEPGSVVVEGLLSLESHPTVHHLVSTVRGRLTPGRGLADVLRAVFPGGSITGAPKVRAMEIIAELEDGARGVYTGALGLFDPAGDLELSLPIRTAVVEQGRVTYHAGGGIVADSDPERELAECWLKTAALRRALGEAEQDHLPQCSSG
jgi:aminodeoxychorismate synthase component I